MQAGADPSLRDTEGCSCIHLAAQFGHTALVAYFIARGVNADLRDRGGMTALMWVSSLNLNFVNLHLLVCKHVALTGMQVALT